MIPVYPNKTRPTVCCFFICFFHLLGGYDFGVSKMFLHNCCYFSNVGFFVSELQKIQQKNVQIKIHKKKTLGKFLSCAFRSFSEMLLLGPWVKISLGSIGFNQANSSENKVSMVKDDKPYDTFA